MVKMDAAVTLKSGSRVRGIPLQIHRRASRLESWRPNGQRLAGHRREGHSPLQSLSSILESLERLIPHNNHLRRPPTIPIQNHQKQEIRLSRWLIETRAFFSQ